MKQCVGIFLFIVILLFSCSLPNSNISVNITKSVWSTETNSNFGYVYLTIVGVTTGAKVCVRTYGDGVVADTALSLNSNKEFSNKICIQFSHAPDTNQFTCNTVITAYELTNLPSIVSGGGSPGSGYSISTNISSDSLQYYQ